MDEKKIKNISKISDISSNISLLLGFLIVLKVGYDRISNPGMCPINGNISLIRMALVLLALSFILGLVSDYFKKRLIENKIK